MKISSKIFNFFTFLMSLYPVIVIILIFTFLLYYALPAIRFNGLSFFTTYLWNPGKPFATPVYQNGVLGQADASFGMLLFLLGTVVTSTIAIVIALPVSFLISLNVEMYLYSRAKKGVVTLIELFAGIPSVVYGLWGILVLGPILYTGVEPWMATNLGFIPGFGGVVTSEFSFLGAGIILSLMITPIITSVLVNSFESVPKDIKDGLFSLGATKWEVGKYLITGYSRSSTVGGTLLGLGRGLGETMAVLMVGGGALNYLPTNIYSATNTMAAAIASYLDSALQDATGMSLYALAELGLVLVIISTFVNLLGRLIAGRAVLRGSEVD